MNKRTVLYFLLLLSRLLPGDTLSPFKLRLSGYLETYYSYDAGKPLNHLKPAFFFNYNRHNEIGLNLGFLKASCSSDYLRGNFALMAGTYAQYNLAHEPGALRNVFEANIGLKLSRKNEIWIDVGIMPSHIGFESAVGSDCWNLSRSILAENSPYYESGVKIAYTTINKRIYAALMYLNGWQRIQKVNGNQTPAIGTQITYEPNELLEINWSTYSGNEFPDSLLRWRYFNNLYVRYQVTEKFGVIAGYDFGVQQGFHAGGRYDTWYSPVLIARYKTSVSTFLAARIEYYSDEAGVIIKTGTQNGFKTAGCSLNYDYSPRPGLLLRIEGRALSSKDRIFQLNSRQTNVNYALTASMAIQI